uniref:WW domain-containing protein n=1 Tax=Haptolina brevifila TaxID=156173 RepID=A0A7S2JQL4_9EUKA|mmetsp:Transcript_86365/g.172404  ORF Transcript_86365/g.172404 Transcript_86365/m.172404 type:complete len:123 (+) Transcript_86365:79-447(+)
MEGYEVYTVQIPPHVGPGQNFEVEHLGTRFTITAPAIPPPDGLMQIQLPSIAALQQLQRQREQALAMQHSQQQQALAIQNYQRIFMMQAQPQQQPGEWEQRIDPQSNRSYRINTRTGEAQWL